MVSGSNDQLIAFLERFHCEIMAIERDALADLAVANDTGYRQKMRQKAEKLACLYDQCAAFANPASGEAAARIRAFSANAGTALDLDSVFYMSALLYPDDHKPGQPDNLAALIAELKSFQP